MANFDKEMYDTWQRLLREDGHLRGTDFFAFRLGWLECKAAQQKYALDAANAAPVEADSKSDIIPAGEVDSQPRQ